MKGGTLEVELTGWLVLINGELYIIEEDYGDNYKNSAKIRISNRYIACVLVDVVAPLGGGESFLFHKVNAFGCLEVGKEPVFSPKEIFIEGRNNYEMVSVDLSPDTLSHAKEKYGDMFKPRKGKDWLDDFI